MKILEPGHIYALECLDTPTPQSEVNLLSFVKRVGKDYPGNELPSHSGTNCQEVLRALVDRAKYLNNQVPCAETTSVISLLETAILLFEIRTKRVKGKTLHLPALESVATLPVCPECLHILCSEHTQQQPAAAVVPSTPLSLITKP